MKKKWIIISLVLFACVAIVTSIVKPEIQEGAVAVKTLWIKGSSFTIIGGGTITLKEFCHDSIQIEVENFDIFKHVEPDIFSKIPYGEVMVIENVHIGASRFWRLFRWITIYEMPSD